MSRGLTDAKKLLLRIRSTLGAILNEGDRKYINELIDLVIEKIDEAADEEVN